METNIFLSISLTGAALIGFICVNQLDLKVIIAYSSVAHMRLVIGGLLYLRNLGLVGAIMLIIAHGLSSSVMFFGGNVLYTRRLTRRVLLRKGIISVFLAGIYSMILYSRTQQSVFFSNKILIKNSLASERLVFYAHLFLRNCYNFLFKLLL